MFILPPPPRYPTQAAYNAAVAAGHAAPMIETNNILTNPTGPEYQLLVGEGVYVLKEDLLLATPPPHPSEAQIQSTNPLATTPQPATTGTKVSLLTLSSRPTAPLLYKVGTNLSIRSNVPTPLSISIPEHPFEARTSLDTSSNERDPSVTDSIRSPLSLTSSAPAFGEGNAALVAEKKGNEKDKRRKPKNNIAKSNSSFISRVIVSETLSKRLQEHDQLGYFAFANVNRAFQWLDMTSPNKQEHLTKILFTKAHCLCHDLNTVTKSISHIDLIMGFSTGEIIWYEPISQKYTRLNKNGVINATPVTQIRWIPGSENLFLASHMDGSLVVYDKEKEDAAFITDEKTNGDLTADASSGLEAPSAKDKLFVEKSVHSHHQKVNPVAFWKLSNQRINSLAFSPDNRHLAVVAEDGSLRIIDYLKEQLLDLYTSYYGGMTCVCWSPDGKYVLTGGQDDLVSIWSVSEACIVARCQGHQSWVTDVAFDPWRCDDRNYRFGSVGEDSRLLLWDFSVGMLHRPKASSVRHRPSISSRYPGGDTLGRTQTQNSHFRSSVFSANNEGEDDDQDVRHPVEPRSNVPMLPPVLNKSVDKDPLAWLTFTEEAILISCKTGHVRTWDRPKDVPVAGDTP